jgi:hypothetical protein
MIDFKIGMFSIIYIQYLLIFFSPNEKGRRRWSSVATLPGRYHGNTYSLEIAQ